MTDPTTGGWYLKRVLRPAINRSIRQIDEDIHLLRQKLAPEDHEARIAMARRQIVWAEKMLDSALDALDHVSVDQHDITLLGILRDDARRIGGSLSPYWSKGRK